MGGPTTASLSLHLPPPRASHLPFFLPLCPFTSSFLPSSLPTCPPAHIPTFWSTSIYTPSTHPVFMAPPCSRPAVLSLPERPPPCTLSARSTMTLHLLGVQPSFHIAMVLGTC